MIKKRLYFGVGLFVLTGICIAVTALVWVGASQYFQKGTRYVTYFNESVQGLQVDSSVKYLGVDVGRVEKIRLAPDYKLIEVVMKIDFPGDLAGMTVSTLKMAGLTGIVYVELDRRQPKDAGLSPKLSFTLQYPAIPSRPSDIRQITASVDEIIQKIRGIDFAGIGEQVKSTTKAIETLVADDGIKKTIVKLESAVSNIERLTVRVNGILAGINIEGLVEEAGETVKGARAIVTEARAAMAKARSEVDSLNLSATQGKLNDLVDAAQGNIGAITLQVRSTAETLDRASLTLEELLDRLKADPSQLIFGEPPPQDKTR